MNDKFNSEWIENLTWRDESSHACDLDDLGMEGPELEESWDRFVHTFEDRGY